VLPTDAGEAAPVAESTDVPTDVDADGPDTAGNASTRAGSKAVSRTALGSAAVLEGAQGEGGDGDEQGAPTGAEDEGDAVAAGGETGDTEGEGASGENDGVSGSAQALGDESRTGGAMASEDFLNQDLDNYNASIDADLEEASEAPHSGSVKRAQQEKLPPLWDEQGPTEIGFFTIDQRSPPPEKTSSGFIFVNVDDVNDSEQPIVSLVTRFSPSEEWENEGVEQYDLNAISLPPLEPTTPPPRPSSAEMMNAMLSGAPPPPLVIPKDEDADDLESVDSDAEALKKSELDAAQEAMLREQRIQEIKDSIDKRAKTEARNLLLQNLLGDHFYKKKVRMTSFHGFVDFPHLLIFFGLSTVDRGGKGRRKERYGPGAAV
jgi:hypothetical protein